MSRSKSIEELLARLHELRGKACDPAAVEELRAALGSRVNLVAARAAEIAGQARLRDLAPDLAVAFSRFAAGTAAADKGCAARTAIARALDALEEPADEVFLAGARTIQREPSYGGAVDTAAELRGVCGIALSNRRHREAMSLLVDLLADPEPQPRIAAARALGASSRDDAALLLRLHLHHGDRSGDVLAECFAAVLSISAERHMGFVAQFLDSPDPAVQESAALGIGESRHPLAFSTLREHFDGSPAFLLPMALTRDPESVAFLIGQIDSASDSIAASAIDALSMYRRDAEVRDRIRAAAERRGGAALRRFEQAFSAGAS